MNLSLVSAQRAVLFLLLGCVAIFSPGCVSLPYESRAAAELTASFKSEHFDIRYRPVSKTAREVAQVSAAAERELEAMCRLFEVKNDQRYTFYLFDRLSDFQRVLKGSATLAGFAYSRSGFFVLNDPAMAHELAHLVAGIKLGPAASTFLSEGLANVIFDETKTATYDAEARYLLLRKGLPALAALGGLKPVNVWIAEHPGVDVYRVGGSWMRYLLRRFGVEKFKKYYLSADTVKSFGAPLDVIEAEWHEWLRSRRLTSRAEDALNALHTHAEGQRVIMAEETFHFEVSVPENELVGAEFFWEKNGKRVPEMDGVTLMLVPAKLGDAGVYDLVRQSHDERTVGFRLKIEVVDPVIFLPAQSP